MIYLEGAILYGEFGSPTRERSLGLQCLGDMVYKNLLVFIFLRNLHLALRFGSAGHGPAIGKVCGIHLSNPIKGELGAIREGFPLTSAFAGVTNPHTMSRGVPGPKENNKNTGGTKERARILEREARLKFANSREIGRQ